MMSKMSFELSSMPVMGVTTCCITLCPERRAAALCLLAGLSA